MNDRVSVNDVGVVLDGLRVLEGASLEVGEGRLVGLVGPNGSGKTTLIRTINSLIQPGEGEVLLGGDSVEGLGSREVGRRAATVPQNTDISFEFSVKDIVEMGRNPHVSRFGRDTEPGVVEDALRRTEVKEFRDRSIRDVSGGERQRVLIARALAQRTPVLLLDEPTASLDINHQVRTLELVRDLVDGEGKSALVAIHDVDLAARYCDEIALMSEGRVVSRGEPEDVLTRENVMAVFGTEAAVSGNPVTGSPEVTPLRRAEKRGVSVHVVGGGGSAQDILRDLWTAGYDVSVGVIHEGDNDLVAARALGVDALSADAFQRVDVERVKEYVDDADVCVVADVDVGRSNLPNLEAALDAERLVVVEDRVFEERNHVGERAREVYLVLRGRGVVVESGGVVGGVERVLGRQSALVEGEVD